VVRAAETIPTNRGDADADHADWHDSHRDHADSDVLERDNRSSGSRGPAVFDLTDCRVVGSAAERLIEQMFGGTPQWRSPDLDGLTVAAT
jgi:hypothetical protein